MSSDSKEKECVAGLVDKCFDSASESFLLTSINKEGKGSNKYLFFISTCVIICIANGGLILL